MLKKKGRGGGREWYSGAIFHVRPSLISLYLFIYFILLFGCSHLGFPSHSTLTPKLIIYIYLLRFHVWGSVIHDLKKDDILFVCILLSVHISKVYSQAKPDKILALFQSVILIFERAKTFFSGIWSNYYYPAHGLIFVSHSVSDLHSSISTGDVSQWIFMTQTRESHQYISSLISKICFINFLRLLAIYLLIIPPNPPLLFPR